MTDVAIVGGGLAGLAAARTLSNAGVRCTLLEATDTLGGNSQSVQFDDVTVDTGFQLLNSWYPSIKELLSTGEYAALNMRTFDPGIMTFLGDAHAYIGDPVRSPRILTSVLSKSTREAVSIRDLFGLRRWLGTELSHKSSLELRTISDSRRNRDVSVRESLDKSGVTRRFRTSAADPLVRALLLDTDGETSAIFAKWVFGTLLRGSPALPARGIGDLANLLSRNSGVRMVFNTRVTGLTVREDSGLTSGHVELALWEHGTREKYRYVILAVPSAVEAQLLGTKALPGRGKETFWFLSDEPVTSRPVITVDGTGSTPIASVAEVTAAAPGYAPQRHLVQGTVAFGGSPRALRADDVPTTEQMRAQMGQLFGVDSSGWELVTRQHLPDASPVLTAQRATLNAHANVLWEGHVALAGAQHATPSIDGTLRSGQRAARRIVELLDA